MELKLRQYATQMRTGDTLVKNLPGESKTRALGGHPGGVHVDGNRTLEEGHRKHEAALPSEVQ